MVSRTDGNRKQYTVKYEDSQHHKLDRKPDDEDTNSRVNLNNCQLARNLLDRPLTYICRIVLHRRDYTTN